MTREHRLDLALPPREVLAAVARVAEGWGAEWQAGINGGRLELPVVAGIRRGVLTTRLSVEPDGSGSSVSIAVEGSRFAVHRQAAAVLGLGAAGGLTVVLWPFFPGLAGVAPLGGLLAMAAWFLVASRLRSSGPEDFLELLAAAADETPPET